MKCRQRKRCKVFSICLGMIFVCIYNIWISEVFTYAAYVTYAKNIECENFEKYKMNMKDAANTINIPDEQSLYAQSAVLIDGDSGRILYSKNADSQMPMASTTKIMTCILALELGKPDDVVTVSDYASSMPEVSLGMQAGEQFYLKDLLYSMMLESHNDTAVAIAEHIAGSVEEFAQLMNKKAANIGCIQTYFITPNGLDAECVDNQGNHRIHETTASELAQILRYCMVTSKENEAFKQITTTTEWAFGNVEGTRTYHVSNHNAYLTMRDGASSGKTGFTAKAGYCYTGSVYSEGRLFIVALLACGWPGNKSYKWHDMNVLIDYGTTYFHYRDVYQKMQFEDISVENGIYTTMKDHLQIQSNIQTQKKTVVAVEEDFSHKSPSLKLLLREDETPEITVDVAKKLEAPVTKGQLVGMVTYKIDGKTVERYPVIAQYDVRKIDFIWSFQTALTKVLP